MEFMDLIKCSKCRFTKGCFERTTEGKNENERNTEDFVFARKSNEVGNTSPVMNAEPVSIAYVRNNRYDHFAKVPLSRATSRSNSMYQPVSELSDNTKDPSGVESVYEGMYTSLETGEDKDFRCPRCGRRMQEPRLLPCLHPMCSPCVAELMNTPICTSSEDSVCGTESRNRLPNFYDTCPLCDFRLSDINSTLPPPHYPLQHRLVMNAIRCRLANRVLCDACSGEVIALGQCSTCLRNFCSHCGTKHQQQITMELRPSKHVVKPLSEATKVRRTALCPKHPMYALRFYCIACQQVTCKECMWSIQHRGHASESAIGAGKRAALYLITLLQKAKTLLNTLLTQYDRDIFLNNAVGQLQGTCHPSENRCIRFPIFAFYCAIT